MTQMNGIWPTRADYDRCASRAIELLQARGIDAKAVGSYATGSLRIPYSDLDVLAIAPDGHGAAVRDQVIDAARAMDDVVCVTVDPFDRQAIVYSIHSNGLQIDWFVVEGVGGAERPVWRGERAQPVDVTCRAWSSLLYTLSVALRGETADAARNLEEHWVWLSMNGIDVSTLPAIVPAGGDDVVNLIRRTASALPVNDTLSAVLYSRLPRA
jgi:hypothetical protein